MQYNFNEKIDRRNNHSAKWSEMDRNFISNDLWPMWIADMDLKTAPEVTKAIERKASEGIFGYVYRPDGYYRSAKEWCKDRFSWDIDVENLIHTPGVVPGISLMIRLFTKPGDKVMIQTPVYYPFSNVVKKNGRKLVTSSLLRDKDGHYTMDFEDFEKKAKDPEVKFFILCNPHNPVGRSWKREELAKIGKICLENNVRIISDEIWRDLVMPGHTHTPMASISKEIEDITITCFSAAKTFNLAGLQAAFLHFPRLEEREVLDTELGILDIKRNNPYAIVAAEAAFTQCHSWVDQLVEHINGNMDYLVEYVSKNLPRVRVQKPEATYLVWLDFKDYGLGKEKLSKLMQEKGKIALDDGFWFGVEGEGFERINVACPRQMLEEGMRRISKAVESL
ncbi:aminotransferase [Propionigenium maris DSM 9537]|uniref:cysteine-S-conjugate beta-lyase n=1 Tax=Propionigenium maris DSM 9537 TaxID=1123000 RepID=A0A9W6LQ71_9FUSO|nr:MalY/PatB family protein [Propionigenium maris]GLI58160.1 aminotransferase [Propionigenium maris DSM 9537]